MEFEHKTDKNNDMKDHNGLLESIQSIIVEIQE